MLHKHESYSINKIAMHYYYKSLYKNELVADLTAKFWKDKE